MPGLESLVLFASIALGFALVALLVVGRRLRRPRIGRWPAWFAVVAVTAAVAPLTPADRLACSLILAAGGAVVLAAVPRRWWPLGAAFLAAIVTAFALYAAYLVRATFVLGTDPVSLLLGIVLLLMELGALLLILASAYEMLDVVTADTTAPARPAAPSRWPRVCLQVPAYNEPPDLVIETVESLCRLDYPRLVVQVIDNNTTDAALWKPVEEACRRLREAGHDVRFAHLPRWPGYKSGALNWGLRQLAEDVDIIGIVDADYIVRPDYLRATIPHFNDPAVAFVQTPQDYREWRHSDFYRRCYYAFKYFFAISMVSRANRNAIIFAGTMGLIRRRLLEEVGGWDEVIITEDAEMSLRILALGYRGVYLPESYGQGIMPLTYEGLRKQRFRWAFGGSQILRKHWRLLLPWSRRSRLTLAQRYDHLVGGVWWFSDALTLAFTLFVLAAGIGLVFDRPFAVHRLSPMGIVLPVFFIAMGLARYLWGFRSVTDASLSEALGALRVNLSLSWVVALAYVRGLIEERGVFLRTPKFRGNTTVRELRLVATETALAVIGVGLAIAISLTADPTPPAAVIIALLAWSIVIYGSATTFALGDPERGEAARGRLAQKALLEIAPRIGRAMTGRPMRAGVGVVPVVAVVVVFALTAESGRPPPLGALPLEAALIAAPESRPTVTGSEGGKRIGSSGRAIADAVETPSATSSAAPGVAAPTIPPFVDGPGPAREEAAPVAVPTPAAAAPQPTVAPAPAPPAAAPTPPTGDTTTPVDPAEPPSNSGGQPTATPTPPAVAPTPPAPGRP